MQFITPFALLALFGAVSGVTVNEPLVDLTSRASLYPDCEVSHSVLHTPDTLTPGTNVTIKWCTGTYFKTSSHALWVGINRNEDALQGSVMLAQKTEADIQYGPPYYEFDVYIQPQGGNFN
ncbi:hypothetical protein DL96DRAFT_1826349 [Flagelloscypha sp. PMI_526]|nr:hypothetical protein DL96DRAFT_1826349 [Flagelloscypha sp. PMI_526]